MSKEGYQSIPSAEPDGGGDGEEPMEHPAQESGGDNISNGGVAGRGQNLFHALAMFASAALLLLLAFLGGRRSYSSGGGGYGGGGYDAAPSKEGGGTIADDLGNVPNRPCEIYHDTNDGERRPTKNVRVIQTSLGTPSEQWSEVACAHRRSSPPDERRPGSEDGGYSRPSAIVDVDFDSVAFPDREPILGFGGAFTEAAALNFGSLSEEGRNVALELLFGRDGLGYRYVVLFV